MTCTDLLYYGSASFDLVIQLGLNFFLYLNHLGCVFITVSTCCCICECWKLVDVVESFSTREQCSPVNYCLVLDIRYWISQ